MVLLAAIFWTVIAFGGMEPITFAVAQTAVWLLAALALWREDPTEWLRAPAARWLGLLLAYGVFQWAVVTETPSEVRDALLRWLTYACVFFLTFWMCRNGRLRRLFLLALVALGVAEALYGLVQVLAGFPYVLIRQNPHYAHRATGTFINPNHFSGFLEMVLPLGLALVFYEREKLQSSAREREAKTERRPLRLIFFFSLTVLVFLGILFSRSRMGLFCVLAAVAVMALLWGTAPWRRSRAVPVLLAFVLAAGAFAFWLGLEPLVERFESVETGYRARQGIWEDTVSLVQARPFFGAGLGTFAVHYPKHQTTFLTRRVRHAHNDYLQFAAELGLVGAALLFGLLLALLIRQIAAFYGARRAADRFVLLGCSGSVLALLFHSLADFNLQIPGNAIVFVAILGLGYAVRRSPSDHEND